jgi:hypothetical protein
MPLGLSLLTNSATAQLRARPPATRRQDNCATIHSSVVPTGESGSHNNNKTLEGKVDFDFSRLSQTSFHSKRTQVTTPSS